MREVLIVTSAQEQCGIREHSEMLAEALEPYGWKHTMRGPDAFADAEWWPGPLVVIDHQAGLHREWGAAVVQRLQRGGKKVIVIQHDTQATFQEMEDRGFHDLRCADALVIHEPVSGLEGPPNVHVIRKGVLGPQPAVEPYAEYHRLKRPCVGTFGFAIPHKGQTDVVAAAARAGWGCLLIAPRATDEMLSTWIQINPRTVVITEFMPRERVVQALTACDATAWLYRTEQWQSGTSGAIRFGLAARRPLIAYRHRQFRDLFDEPLLWAGSQGEVTAHLSILKVTEGWTAQTVAEIAERDSWGNVGRRMAAIYDSCWPAAVAA